MSCNICWSDYSTISTNNNKTKMSEKLDVVGIGNAMVDAIIHLIREIENIKLIEIQ